MKIATRGLRQVLGLGAFAAAIALASGTAHAGKKNDTLLWLTEFEPPNFLR